MWLSAWVFAHVLAPDALVTPAAQAAAGAASKAEDACVSTDKSVPQEWCAKTCAMDPAGAAALRGAAERSGALGEPGIQEGVAPNQEGGCSIS